LGRPDLTAERFVPNPFRHGERLYRSGDLARFVPGVDMEYLGRMDKQVKIRGFRIESGEIEAMMLKYPGVRESVVIVRNEDSAEKRLIGYVVSSEPVSTADVRAFLKEKLPEYMVPAAIVSLDALPLTTNGKINRSALPDMTGDTETYTAPQTATQKTLASVWASVLGLKIVGIHDDFFDIGGQSLLIMRVQSRIRDIFQVELPLNQLFEVRTIAELAQVLVKYESVPGQIEKIANLHQKIEAMSEEEVKAMLKEKKKG